MRIVDYTGRALGAISGALVSALWMLGVWLPESGMALTGINFVVAMLMALLGLFAAIASIRAHAAVLLIVFVASFFPVGITLLGGEHWLSWAGRLNVCYLVASVLIWLARRRAPQAAGDVPG
jgi:hypothetical protein